MCARIDRVLLPIDKHNTQTQRAAAAVLEKNLPLRFTSSSSSMSSSSSGGWWFDSREQMMLLLPGPLSILAYPRSNRRGHKKRALLCSALIILPAALCVYALGTATRLRTQWTSSSPCMLTHNFLRLRVHQHHCTVHNTSLSSVAVYMNKNK